MGNVIESFGSGFANAIGNLFKAPLDFVSGKSCSSICGSTWDFICYVEHFCVAELFKLGLIILVIYIVLFFFYISYKLGIFHCICHTLCKTTWTCFETCSYIWIHIFHFCCHKLLRPRRRLKKRHHNNHTRDIEDLEYSSQDNDNVSDEGEEGSCHSQIDVSQILKSRRWREHRRSHLRRSLRPRSHRVRVEISHHDSARHHIKHRNRNHNVSNVHNSFKVAHTSKFAHKCRDSKRIAAYRSGRS